MSLNQLISPIKALDIVVDKINGQPYPPTNSGGNSVSYTVEDDVYIMASNIQNINTQLQYLNVEVGDKVIVPRLSPTDLYDVYSFSGSLQILTNQATQTTSQEIIIDLTKLGLFGMQLPPLTLFYINGYMIQQLGSPTYTGYPLSITQTNNQISLTYELASTVLQGNQYTCYFDFKCRNTSI